MGVICHGQSPKIENEITRINVPIFFDKNYLDKIILIQKNYRIYNAKKNNFANGQAKINKELESAKSSVIYWEKRKDEFDNKLQLCI